MTTEQDVMTELKKARAELKEVAGRINMCFEQQANESQLVIADKIAEIDRLKLLLQKAFELAEDVPGCDRDLGYEYLAGEYRKALNTIYGLLENDVTYPEREPTIPEWKHNKDAIF